MYYKKIVLVIYFLTPFLYAKPASIESVKKVEVALLADLLVTKTHHPVAEVQLINQTNLSAEINAPIKTIHVLIGDQVKKNQVLIDLKCGDLQWAKKVQKAQLNQAKVSALYAEKQYQRAKKLVRKKSMSIENKERRESTWKQAEALVAVQSALFKQSASQLKKCQIKAPFAGIITQRLSSVGSFAAIGQPLLQISGEQVEVSSLLNQTDIASLLKAKKPLFVYQGQTYPVKIRSVVKIRDKLTHNQEIRLIFKDKKAPAGAFGKLTWKTAQHWLPTQYIHRRKQQLGYFIWNKATQTTQFKALTNAIEGVPFALKQITPQFIITKGVYNLQTGDKVKVIKQ